MVGPPHLQWYCKDAVITETPSGILVQATSDVMLEMRMIYSYTKTRIIRAPQIRRGYYSHDRISFYQPGARILRQRETALTYLHTFDLEIPRRPIWVYFYFAANIPPSYRTLATAPFKHLFRGVDMFVRSLARYGDLEGQILEGDVKLEEGPYITLTRIPEHNSLRITGTAPALIGFYQGLLTYPSAHPSYDIAIVTFDQVTLGLSYSGDNLRIYTPGSISHNFKAPHTMQIAAMRSPDAAGTLTTYLALLPGLTDLHNALTTPHIAIICRGNKIYASNANGTARTETQIDPVGPYETKWLRWNRTSTGIEFYVDGVLKATHTTNIPGNRSGLRFLYQAIGTYNAPRLFYASAPRITET